MSIANHTTTPAGEKDFGWHLRLRILFTNPVQKQYEEQYEHGFNHRENFRNEFHIKSPNQEKPVSHKIFHITIFGGLALITLWIVLSEILK